MTDYSLSLVAFTTLSQTAVGLAVVLAWRTCTAAGPVASTRRAWFWTGAIMAAALCASLFHLAYPLRAYDALQGLATAWLSREVLIAGLFGLGIAAAFLGNGSRVLAALAALLGLALTAAQGLTYASPAMPAIANSVPFFLFGLTVWVMGAACAPLLEHMAPRGEQRHLAHTGQLQNNMRPSPDHGVCLLRQGLWMLLLLLLVLPCVWASGGTIMRLTALAWAGSWFYWSGIACLAAGLVFASKPHFAVMTASTLFAGVVLTRLAFFGDTVSCVVNIGSPF